MIHLTTGQEEDQERDQRFEEMMVARDEERFRRAMKGSVISIPGTESFEILTQIEKKNINASKQ